MNFCTIIFLLTLFFSLNSFSQESKYGADSAQAVTNFSLYKEFYKMYDEYKDTAYLTDAVAPWFWVIANAPKISENIYIDGANIVKFLINKEKDAVQKQIYIDTLMMVYDRRIIHFGKECSVLARKCTDYYKYRKDSTEQAYKLMKYAFEKCGNASSANVLYLNFIATRSMIKTKKLDTSIIIDVFSKTIDAIDFNVKKGGKKAKQYENIETSILAMFEPFSDCKKLASIYNKKLDEAPDDLELLKKITETLDKFNCTNESVYFDALQKLNAKEPSAFSAFQLGKLSSKQAKYSVSADFLKEAVSLFDDVNDKEDKINSYLLLAENYTKLGQFSTARSYAINAINLNPNCSRAYLLIGDLYAQSGKTCYPDDSNREKFVYWVAVDKYMKAMSVDEDPKIQEIAKDRIATYKKSFVSCENLFFLNIKNGDSVKVECWINETTIARCPE
ncbi:tetratricopeptide repeat protein [Bacteroidota bacterium]